MDREDELLAVKQEIAEVDLQLTRLRQHRLNLAARRTRLVKRMQQKESANYRANSRAKQDTEVVLVEALRPHLIAGIKELFDDNHTQFCLRTGFDPRYVRCLRNSNRKKYITVTVADELLTALNRFEVMYDLQRFDRWTHKPLN